MAMTLGKMWTIPLCPASLTAFEARKNKHGDMAPVRQYVVCWVQSFISCKPANQRVLYGKAMNRSSVLLVKIQGLNT
jgi:hypothetical protein